VISKPQKVEEAKTPKWVVKASKRRRRAFLRLFIPNGSMILFTLPQPSPLHNSLTNLH
jgi:hypothetical protein